MAHHGGIHPALTPLLKAIQQAITDALEAIIAYEECR